VRLGDKSLLTARFRQPRLVVGVIYPTGSMYLTSHEGIAGVPGQVVYGCLEDVSSSSQQIFPDEGRSTIGGLTFTAVDLSQDISSVIRDQLLTYEYGIRNREVRVWTGDDDNFNRYTRVDTFVIDSVVELDGRSYRFTCSDRTRELRTEVFVQVGTKLTTTLGLDDTEVFVENTAGFESVQHTASFSDAPNERVGYFRVRKTGEVIRYTSKTDTSFTGCVRERFSTIAQEVEVAGDVAPDKRPEIEEFIYLEMPAPQLAYAVMTGRVLGTAYALPVTWNLGVSEAHADSASFTNVGSDLFDVNDLSDGLILRFTHLEKTDGKRFIEEQVNVPCGAVIVVDAMGRLRLRRVSALIANAAPMAVLNEDNIISHGSLRHVQSRLINEIELLWNYDGEEYTRNDILFNNGSIESHGAAPPRRYELAGLYVSDHTRGITKRVFNMLVDRYGAPPIELSMQASSVLNVLEVADTVLVNLPSVQDYAGPGALNRVFEVQSVSRNWTTGVVELELFGSTARTIPDIGPGVGEFLPDAFYSSFGTPLSSVLTIVDDHIIAGGHITGSDDARMSVYYHTGPLTLDSGVTVTWSDNVQLRVMGEFAINGKLDGKGLGIPGTVSPQVVSNPEPTRPAADASGGYFGASRSSDSLLRVTYTIGLGSVRLMTNNDGAMYEGVVQSLPVLDLAVESGVLWGAPSNLRGVPGQYGAAIGSTVAFSATPPTVLVPGGHGGAGGAGLVILCRGLSFGVSGQIDTSGGDGGAAALASISYDPPGGTQSLSLYAGAGAGGAPGGLYVLLDGDDLLYPEINDADHFVANQGITPAQGSPPHPWSGGPPGTVMIDTQPASGLNEQFLSGHAQTEAAGNVQYVPREIPLGGADDELVQPPVGLVVIDASGAGLSIGWTPPPTELYDYVEVWESIDNDRANAIRIALVRGDSFSKTSATLVTNFYWVRAVKQNRGASIWEPVSDTAGVEATFGGAVGADSVFFYIKPISGTALHNGVGELTVEAHRLAGGTDVHLSTGTIKLYVGSTEVTVANGYAAGSDGYTGVFDASDIGGDAVVEIKDGPAGQILDTITLVDIADGGSATSPVNGYIEPSGPLTWIRATDQSTWTPSASTLDLDCTFVKAGAAVARRAWRITRDADGLLTGSSTVHKDGDLNTARVTVTELSEDSFAMGVKFDYAFDTDLSSVAETAMASLSGYDGTDGAVGADSGGMIANGSFEVGSMLGWVATLQATALNDAGKAHSGTWSARVGQGSVGLRTAPTYRASVQPGQRLVATAYVARDSSSLPDANGEFYIRWEDTAGALVGTSSVITAVSSTAGWQTLSVEAGAPTGTTHAVVVFTRTAGAAGHYLVDDVTLTLKGADAVSTSVFASAATQFVQAPNGGAWSHSVVDITFWFIRSGGVIATHVIRFTRGGTGTITAATLSESGEATVESIISNGTDHVTSFVQHTASAVSTGQTVTSVQGGAQGATGATGAAGTGSWTPVLSANMTQSGKTFAKVSSNGSWNAGFYSSERYGACVAQFQPAQANRNFMIGLNSDPSTDHSYTSIDFALYCHENGSLYEYRNGADQGVIGTYATNDALEVNYDGNKVRYIKNGAVLRTTFSAGLRLAIDSSFYNLATAHNVVFAPIAAGEIDLQNQVFNQLQTAFAAAGLINTNISVNADGSLVGAGGGAPVLSSLTGSVAVGQLTTNVLAALQAVVGNLSAIRADLGTINAGTITYESAGYIRSPAIGYDGEGIFLGRDGGEPAFSIRTGGTYLRFKPSIGYPEFSGLMRQPVQTFAPDWLGFSVPPVGDISYIDFGNYAIVFAPVSRTGTSNDVTMSITNLPAVLQPSGGSSIFCPCMVIDGWTSTRAQPGGVLVNASTLSFFCTDTATFANRCAIVPDGFRNSLTKGVAGGFTIVYAK
jgi:hypothetical protein